MEVMNTIIKTENGFSTNNLVLKRFNREDTIVIEKAFIPMSTLDNISRKRPPKNPVVSALTNVDVKLI